MAEYLSPGVYVEEVSFRSTKAIAGVGTTTTGFIGPTRYGPVDLENQLITSLDEYERTYGDGQPLDFEDSLANHTSIPNFMWHAARAFFAQGGTKLYVSRACVWPPPATGGDAGSGTPLVYAQRASAWLAPTSPGGGGPRVWARYPGDYGNMTVQIVVRVGQNVLRFDTKTQSWTVGSVEVGDVVMIRPASESANPPLGITADNFPAYLAQWDPQTKSWYFDVPSSPSARISLANLPPPSTSSPPTLEIRVLTLAVTVELQDPNQAPRTWSNLALDPSHQTSGTYDSFVAVFGTDPTNPDHPNPEYGRNYPIFFDQTGAGRQLDGLQLLQALFQANPSLPSALEDIKSTDALRSITLQLTGGQDGQRPDADHYEGHADPDSQVKTGLKQFEDIEDISIVAAPGSTYLIDGAYQLEGQAIMQELVVHCEQMRYRIAVLDSGNGESVNGVRQLRALFDSSYAALYFPWIRVLDPISNNPILLPPSGFVCGIYARNDVTRAVYKAPANEVVSLAQGFELKINKAQQDILNPEGINCFRFFEGRGFRLWGARTVSSDTEWNYVNLRRYFAYLERSIDIGTQWVVFEPNGDKLWGAVRRSIQEFLLNEWQAGALMGTKPEEAFFVRCDRTTMTQSDIDNGRLVCLVGVAALRPAEFVIFRIGQWTGDRVS
jgi:phage tail sheath protein FI